MRTDVSRRAGCGFGAERDHHVLRRHPDQGQLLPDRCAAGGKRAPTVSSVRAGARPVPPTPRRHRPDDRRDRDRPAARCRLQRPHLGSARVRRLRRRRPGRQPRCRGARRQAPRLLVAKQPEAKLDSKRDPRVGMTGASYGGGIQLSPPRSTPHRRDRARHRLALADDEPLQGLDLQDRLGNAALHARQGDRRRSIPHIDSAYAAGQTTGHISKRDEEWFRSRGPGDLVNKIKVPTLLIQGTVDTLFTLDEAITNYRVLSDNGVPVKMLWFCGGHGALPDRSRRPEPGRATRRSPGSTAGSPATGRSGPAPASTGSTRTASASPRSATRRSTRPSRERQGLAAADPGGGSGPSEARPRRRRRDRGDHERDKALNAVNVKIPGRKAIARSSASRSSR